MILWDHHRMCDPSLTETSLYGAYMHTNVSKEYGARRSTNTSVDFHHIARHHPSKKSVKCQYSAQIIVQRPCRRHIQGRIFKQRVSSFFFFKVRPALRL